MSTRYGPTIETLATVRKERDILKLWETRAYELDPELGWQLTRAIEAIDLL